MTGTEIPIFLDCDTGIDDALALAYLLAAPGADLVGVGTVSGNVSARQAARNTLDLLAIGGRSDIPVAVGALDWLTRGFDGGAPHVHGPHGTGDVELPNAPTEPVAVSAAQLLIDQSHQYEGALRVVGIGPLTNLAVALELDPTITSRVSDVVVMGGAAQSAGNVTPVAEANIWNDPDAAQRVFSADWSLTVVPLDVTMKNVLEERDRRQLALSTDPLVATIGRMLVHYLEFYRPIYGRASCALHDPLAAAIAAGGVRPTIAPRVPVIVDTTTGPGRGQTIWDLRSWSTGGSQTPSARVVLETDRPLAPHLMAVLR